MSTVGDLITLISIAVALWFVPRYLWRVYRGKAAPSEYHYEPTVQRYHYPEPPPVSAGPRPSPAPPVRPQQDHTEPAQSVDFAAVLAFVSGHNLTDEQAIELFAAAHRAAGDYFLSANKIRDGVGGSRDEVLSQVAALRPRPPAKKIEAHLDRPVKGW